MSFSPSRSRLGAHGPYFGAAWIPEEDTREEYRRRILEKDTRERYRKKIKKMLEEEPTEGEFQPE